MMPMIKPGSLAFVIVPRDHVLEVVDECGRKGIKGLCVISAGFREVGGEGVKREEDLLARVRQYGMRMIGPNCLGLVNMTPEIRLNGTFAPAKPISGRLAFLSQSGALGVSILQSMERLNIGFSYFVSTGNSADVRGIDLLRYWEDDPDTDVIAIYIESFGDPRESGPILRRLTRRKPVVIVKSGRTEAGARAASSHTGALAASDVTVDAFLRQTGTIRAYTIEEMLGLLSAFCRSPLPKGNRVAILTNSGGPGIMATDALVTEGHADRAVQREDTRLAAGESPAGGGEGEPDRSHRLGGGRFLPAGRCRSSSTIRTSTSSSRSSCRRSWSTRPTWRGRSPSRARATRSRSWV